MTEAEWLTATDPAPMLAFLRGKAGDRKLRLFAVACCDRIRHLLSDSRSRESLDVAECYADRMAGDTEREAAEAGARQAAEDAVLSRRASDYSTPEMFTLAARAASYTAGADGSRTLEAASAVVAACGLIALNPASDVGGRQILRKACAATLRDIFGNPFRPVAADPRWLTPAVVGLADAIYAGRHFDRLPVLADALEEAGCEQPDVLAHCRGDGPHVRGCWVVDLVLGKT